MTTKSRKGNGTFSKTGKETPESLRQALKSTYTASAELIQTSKAVLESSNPIAPTSKPPQTSLDAIIKLASLIHSHTVRTALTCGPTASSPSATLACIKELHEPILPLVSEYQNISSGDYPDYFLAAVRKEIISLLDTTISFLGEAVEIACGDAEVESRERLQYSGMMMEICDRLQQICKDGPITQLRKKLRETEEMLTDALEEVVEIVNSAGEMDDEWGGTVEYTPEQKALASRAQSKVRFLSFLYKAVSKRRLVTTLQYDKSYRERLEIVCGCLGVLSIAVDDLVSGISAQEEPMILELSMVQITNEGRKLADALRSPLDGIADGKETWFDTWLEKAV